MLGVLITTATAVIQAVGQNGVVIFLGLDNNGTFHLMQRFGVFALLQGILISMREGCVSMRRAMV